MLFATEGAAVGARELDCGSGVGAQPRRAVTPMAAISEVRMRSAYHLVTGLHNPLA